MKEVEYRVRQVARYVVTRFEKETDPDGRCSGGCETRGEYDNEVVAYEVAYALCRAEHDTSRSASHLDPPEFTYPQPPRSLGVVA